MNIHSGLCRVSTMMAVAIASGCSSPLSVPAIEKGDTVELSDAINAVKEDLARVQWERIERTPECGDGGPIRIIRFTRKDAKVTLTFNTVQTRDGSGKLSLGVLPLGALQIGPSASIKRKDDNTDTLTLTFGIPPLPESGSANNKSATTSGYATPTGLADLVNSTIGSLMSTDRGGQCLKPEGFVVKRNFGVLRGGGAGVSISLLGGSPGAEMAYSIETRQTFEIALKFDPSSSTTYQTPTPQQAM